MVLTSTCTVHEMQHKLVLDGMLYRRGWRGR